MFQRVSAEISQKKNHRYVAEDIRELNSAAAGAEGRECRICGRTDTLSPSKDGTELCRWCSLFESLSDSIQKKDVFLVASESVDGYSFRLPCPNGQAYFLFSDIDTVRRLLRDNENVIRVYSKNRYYAGLNYSTVLYVGDYAKDNQLTKLAESSDGVARLGVCRMDVDDLGQAFVQGFETDGTDPETRGRFVTLSRTAAFSRQMSLFFKNYINAILSGRFGNKQPLSVAIVYSGGDDVFLLGSWNDTIEAAVRIRDAFRAYSCSSLSISAGLAVTRHNFPVRLSADLADKLEKEAKATPGKDALALFEPGELHCFRWAEFSGDVLEKKKTLDAFFGDSENERGTAFLYRLMELLRDAQKNPGNKIQLARYAYILARLKPKEKEAASRYDAFAGKMYEWSLGSDSRKSLITAIYLRVYENRKREKE